MSEQQRTPEYYHGSGIGVGELKDLSAGLKFLLTKKIISGEARVSYQEPSEIVKEFAPSAESTITSNAEYNVSPNQTLYISCPNSPWGQTETMSILWATRERISPERFLMTSEHFEIRDDVLEDLPDDAVAPPESMFYYKALDVLDADLNFVVDDKDEFNVETGLEAIVDRFNEFARIVKRLQS